MNIQEFVNELKAQVTRLTGVQLNENMADDQVLEVLESAPSFSERNSDLEDMVLEFGQKIEEVRASVPADVVSADKVSEMINAAVEGMKKDIEANLSAKLQTISSEFGQHILDLQEKAQAAAKPAGEKLDATVELNESANETATKTVQRRIGGRLIEVIPS